MNPPPTTSTAFTYGSTKTSGDDPGLRLTLGRSSCYMINMLSYILMSKKWYGRLALEGKLQF